MLHNLPSIIVLQLEPVEQSVVDHAVPASESDKPSEDQAAATVTETGGTGDAHHPMKNGMRWGGDPTKNLGVVSPMCHACHTIKPAMHVKVIGRE